MAITIVVMVATSSVVLAGWSNHLEAAPSEPTQVLGTQATPSLSLSSSPTTSSSTSTTSPPTDPVDSMSGQAVEGLLEPLLGRSEPGSEPPPSDHPRGYVHQHQWQAGVATGQYRLAVSISLAEPGRADLLIDGEMVGTHRIGTTTRVVEAILHVDGPESLLGVGAQSALEVRAQSLEPLGPTYTVRGNRILDPSGLQWTPRGANRSGYQEFHDGSPIYNRFGHESHMMRAWGFNFVRLPMNQEFWLEDCPVEHSWVHESPRKADGSSYRYRELIAEEVRRYTDRGMVVLLDLHASARGKATGCSDDGGQLAEMPDARAEPFWHSVAARFGTNPNVAFDVFNEPNFNDLHDPPPQDEQDQIWREGGEIRYRYGLLARNTTYRAVGLQRLYDTIRDTGATNLVFVAGLGFGHDPVVHFRRPLDATGMVVSVHTYCSSSDCSSGQYPEDVVKRRLHGELPGEPDRVGVADRFPVVITEFGTTRWWDRTPNAAYVHHYETHGLGWAVYSWAGGGNFRGQEPYGILADATDRTARRQPNASGQPIWEALAPTRGSR